MKRIFITLAAIAVLSFTASIASADCGFDVPAKAKGLKASMVRAYAACPSITIPAANTVTSTGLPVCSPPVALSSYEFDAKKGKCAYKNTGKVESPCSDGTGDDCFNLRIIAKCSGITAADGSPISAPMDNGWSLMTISRATLGEFNDDQTAVNVAYTVFDFPASFAFSDPKKGKIKLKTDTNALMTALFGPGNALSPCASLSIVSTAIQDGGGNPFAVIGGGGMK